MTALLVVVVVFAVSYVWATYFEAPWTRDARVRADVLRIASNVAGNVVDVDVHNNDLVKAGDVLMLIDPTDYRVAVAQAEANVAEARANVELNKQQSDRLAKLADSNSAAVADVDVQNAELKTEVARASLEAARAGLAAANVKLDWTTIRSPADGYVTNRNVNPGDDAQPGSPVRAVVDEHSYRVEAFFMETHGPVVRVDDWKATTVLGVYAAGDAVSLMHDATLSSASGVLAGIGEHQSLARDRFGAGS